jgi:long-chain acyl-CoA synthetase
MQHAWDRRLGVWWIAEDQPDALAIAASASGTVLTYRELAERAHQLVHALRSRGFAAGDAVAYALPNDVDIVVWQLACQESGLRGIALNPSLSGSEIRAILEHSGATGIAIHHSHPPTTEFNDLSSLRLRVSVGGDIPTFERYDDLVNGQPVAAPDNRQFGVPISYSSGTTGKPKAIDRPPAPGDPSVIADGMKLFGQAFQFKPFDGTHLVTAGMHHGGCQSFYQTALNCGQALVIHQKFDAERTLAAIEEHRVSTAYMVPTQFVRLLRLPAKSRDQYDVSSLQVIVHSAAPCPVEVKRQMMDWWGPVIWETYGGMEGAATIAKPHRWLEKPGTVGRAVRGMTLRVLDDAGDELPAGEVGNVYLESARQTFEYKGDPELTASIHRGRAFTLGDVGYLDADGYLFLRDRAKDMIISGGVNIYPAEVEGVLGTHPCVDDVAVIGLPDDEWGESVLAVVTVTGDAAASAELAAELIAFCRSRLAHFKCPRAVDFRDELPRTDTGKLFKRLLRDEYSRTGDVAERAG